MCVSCRVGLMDADDLVENSDGEREVSMNNVEFAFTDDGVVRDDRADLYASRQ